jgi:hypothetical protein
VSEVIVDGFHLFTGIVRDLTEEVKKERMRQAEEDCLPPDYLEGFRRWAGRDDQQAFMAYTGASEAVSIRSTCSPPNVHKADYAESLAQFKAGARRPVLMLSDDSRVLDIDRWYRHQRSRGKELVSNI